VRHRDRRDVGALRIDELVLPGLMVDLGHLKAGAAAEIDDLRRAAGGALEVAGKAVLCRFGWDRLWEEDAYFTAYPFLSRAALRALIDGGAGSSASIPGTSTTTTTPSVLPIAGCWRAISSSWRTCATSPPSARRRSGSSPFRSRRGRRLDADPRIRRGDMTMNKARKPIATLDEVRALLAEFPTADLEAASRTATREAVLTKPAGALGRLEEITQLAGQLAGPPPPVDRAPRACVFAANHGVAARGVSAFRRGDGADGAELHRRRRGDQPALQGRRRRARVYEMALDRPTADFTEGPAMSDASCANAMAYGMMAVEPGVDLMCLGEMGIANTTSCLQRSAMRCSAARRPTGRAPAPASPAKRCSARRRSWRPALPTIVARRAMGSRTMRCLGGFELAAIAGAVIAARMAHVPVLLDGFACTAAGGRAQGLQSAGARSLSRRRTVSAEPGHRRLLEKLGMKPLLDLGMRLGEAFRRRAGDRRAQGRASPAYAGMATFAEAGVSGKVE
jgi:nicotinate-nucleotide--dimethylbenzimidazole phosphoribosyltransferase